MDETAITDLKQFIASTVTQQGSDIREDLKQFVSATVSQQISALGTELDHRFDTIDHRFNEIDHRFNEIHLRFEEINHRFNELKDFVIDTFDMTNEEHGKSSRRLGARVSRLERKLL